MEYVDGDTLEDVIARHVARARIAAGGRAPRPAVPSRLVLLPAAPRRARRNARARHRPSRREAVEHPRPPRRHREAHRLRHRPPPHNRPERRAIRSRARPGHGRVHVPRAGALRPARRSKRSLFGRRSSSTKCSPGERRSPEDKSEFLVRRDQVETPPPPIRAFVPQAPPVLEHALRARARQDPAARFGSAIEMGDAFRAALG